jgi:hypothetical protein
MEGFVMAKKSKDERMQQLHEAALETVRLQARRPMSPKEGGRLANNLVDILLGRGLPEDSDDCSKTAPDASTSEFDDLVAEILAADPSAKEAEIREELADARRAPDGRWYIPDPARPGKYLMIVLQSVGGISVPAGLHLTSSEESLVAEIMDRFGYSREEAIENLILHGGI